MFPEDNVPSEREWSIEEREEFFKSQDARTGLLCGGGLETLWNNGETNAPFTVSGLHEAMENLESTLYRGIHITSITPPESGWLMSFYCPLCRETWFRLSPWAIKPEDGDYWRIQMCGSDVEGFRHNMQLGMKGWHDPIELKPSNLWWAKEEKP